MASTFLPVNPFDEPNVTETKKNAASILQVRRGPRKVIPIVPIASYDQAHIVSATGIKALERKKEATPEEIIGDLLTGVRPGDFLAILAYIDRTPKHEQALADLRQAIEKKYKIATLRGYGPRYLHSIGQLYKGGPQKGHFLVIEREYEQEHDIPNMIISFGRLIKAQAQGDMKALRKRKRPVVGVYVKDKPLKGVESLTKLVEAL